MKIRHWLFNNITLTLLLCGLSACSSDEVGTWTIATVVFIEDDMSACFKDARFRTTFKTTAGHLSKSCGLYGKVGDEFIGFWIDSVGLTLTTQ
jgi:hypothetical protein